MNRSISKTHALLLGYVIIGATLVGLFSIGVIYVSNPVTSNSKSNSSSVVYIHNSSEIPLQLGSISTCELLMGCLPPGFADFLNVEQFNITSTSVVAGAFNSSTGTEMLIIPSSVFRNDSYLSYEYYTYSTGNVTSENFSITVQPGSYYFVIYNPTTNATDNVTITKGIEATSF